MAPPELGVAKFITFSPLRRSNISAKVREYARTLTLLAIRENQQHEDHPLLLRVYVPKVRGEGNQLKGSRFAPPSIYLEGRSRFNTVMTHKARGPEPLMGRGLVTGPRVPGILYLILEIWARVPHGVTATWNELYAVIPIRQQMFVFLH